MLLHHLSPHHPHPPHTQHAMLTIPEETAARTADVGWGCAKILELHRGGQQKQTELPRGWPTHTFKITRG